MKPYPYRIGLLSLLGDAVVNRRQCFIEDRWCYWLRVDNACAKTYISPHIPIDMSGHQSYIVRLLRQVETSLVGDHSEYLRGVLGQITRRITHTDNLDDALVSLYAVEGFDRFSLRLMWVLERAGISSNDITSEVTEYEVQQLSSVLNSTVTGNTTSVPITITPQSVKPLEDFYEALHRFGRSIEDTRRKSTSNGVVSIDCNSLYRVLNEAGLIEKASLAVGKIEVAVFGSAVTRFIQYVIDGALFDDIRVVNILDNANLTLQTVTEAAGGEEYDSLRQMSALLEHPVSLLE